MANVSDEPLVSSSVTGRVGRIVLADTDHRNALSVAMARQFSRALADLSTDPTVRAIVVCADGAHFSAGGDIRAFDLGLTAGRDYVHEIIGLFRQLEHCRKPAIAAVRGYAFGGGFELALSCDLIVAGESAIFSFPETTVGAIPGYAIVRLPELVGRQRAKYLMWTADRLDANAAKELGLVTSVVADDDVDRVAGELAHRIAQTPRVAAELIKAAVNKDIADGVLFETTTAAALMWGTEGIREGRAAFYERRSARFPDE